MAVVLAAFHRGARLPLLQTDPRLDHCSSAPPGGSRSLDLADCRRLLAVVVGSTAHERGPHALGASATRRIGHSRSSPPSVHRNIGPGEYSGTCTSQTRKNRLDVRKEPVSPLHSTTK